MSVIIWDIDGCVVDFTREVFIPASNELLGRNVDPTNHVQPSWSYQNLLNPDEEAAVWSSPLLDKYIMTAKPLPHAINLLENMTEVVFLTSRGTHGNEASQEMRRHATVQWLDNIGQRSRPIYYAGTDEKLAVAKQLGAKLIWEDYPETVMDYAEAGITVFMPVYEYNKHIRHPNVIRMEGWA